MNKKIVALFLFVFCIIATVVIGIFGKIPDPASRIAVEEIAFIDRGRPSYNFAPEVNDDQEKLIKIQRGNATYQLEWQILPSNATDQSVRFIILSGAAYSSISTTGLITFHAEQSITIRILSNIRDDKSDIVIIEFIGNPDSEEENPFD